MADGAAVVLVGHCWTLRFKFRVKGLLVAILPLELDAGDRGVAAMLDGTPAPGKGGEKEVNRSLAVLCGCVLSTQTATCWQGDPSRTHPAAPAHVMLPGDQGSGTVFLISSSTTPYTPATLLWLTGRRCWGQAHAAL